MCPLRDLGEVSGIKLSPTEILILGLTEQLFPKKSLFFHLFSSLVAFLLLSEFPPMQMLLTVLTLWVFQQIYIINRIYMGSLFHLVCLALLLTCIRFFLCNKTLTFYILFELRLIPTLFIVFLYGYQPEKLQASMYLLLYTVLSSLPLLIIFINSPTYLFFFSPTSSF